MNTNKIDNIEKVANIVSDYWVSRIQNTKHDNGAYDTNSLIANNIADLGVKELSQEQIDGFKKDLKDKIISLINDQKSEFQELYLDCDYHPCGYLYDIAKAHDIPALNFPFKVMTMFNRHIVRIKGSYTSDWKTVYADIDYYQYEKRSCEENIEEFKINRNNIPETLIKSYIASSQARINECEDSIRKLIEFGINYHQCEGEGQGSCTRCDEKGKWNRSWMCFLYEIDGYEGCYCYDCLQEILEEEKGKMN